MTLSEEQLASYQRALREYERVLRLETTIRTDTEPARALIRGFRRCIEPGIYQHYDHTPKKPRLYAVSGLIPILHGNPALVLFRPYTENMTDVEIARPETAGWLLTGDKGFLLPVKKEFAAKPYAGPRLWCIEKLGPQRLNQLFAHH